MHKGHEIQILQHRLVLHPLKALWWPEQSALICSDVHIGKGSHFRSHGIPIPKFVDGSNLWNLVEVIQHYTPRRIIFLGDLFHSTPNSEWNELIDCLDQFPSMKRILVKGNHEILDDVEYERFDFQLHERLIIDQIEFTHEPLEEITDGCFNICGHVHPAVRLSGSARQRLKIPCFWMTSSCGILPAFGAFTGTHVIRPKKEDGVYGFLENQVVKLN
jgi:DNA ligase-associated metallophosphoesterase